MHQKQQTQTHTCLYFSTLTPSSWLRRTRLVPTRILSSCRSFSLFSRSRLWPWCCIRTHNLFISAKFRRTKSMESLMSPVISSVPLWSKNHEFMSTYSKAKLKTLTPTHFGTYERLKCTVRLVWEQGGRAAPSRDTGRVKRSLRHHTQRNEQWLAYSLPATI